MSTVKPPPPLSIAIPRNAPSAPLALAVRVSDAVRALNVGQGLEATRLSSTPPTTTSSAALAPAALAPAALTKGTIQVQTVLGPLTLQTAYPVPRGAVLSLILIQQGPQPQFQITAINAKPVALTPQPNVPTPQTGPPAKALAPGQTLNATLLRPAFATPPTFATPQKPAGPPGTSQTTLPSSQSQNPQTPASPVLNVPRSVQTSPRSGVSQPGTPTPQTVTPQTGTPQNARTIIQPTRVPQSQSPAARDVSQTPTSPTTPTKGTNPVVLPAGTRLRLTIQRLEAPNAAVTTPVLNSDKEAAPTLSARSILTGILTGRTAQGQPIVQTPGALFALDTRTTSADGTRVSLRLDSPPQPPGSTTPLSAARSDELTSSATWSNLNDALRALALADPQRLIQVSDRALPQPGAKLGTQMLFFLSALKGGDVRSLFGDTALRLIDKKRPGLSGRLNDDFRTLAKQANEPQQGDWRLALIPMWSGTQLEQVRFFWRHANGQDTLEDDGEETRFVLDVDLSRMGHLQIDGLLKAKRQHMDLILRTDTPLPKDWRREITDIFNQGRDITGFGGSVAFQAVPANFVQFPTTQTPDSAPGFYA